MTYNVFWTLNLAQSINQVNKMLCEWWHPWVS